MVTVDAPDGGTLYQCPSCGSRFTSLRRYYKHRRENGV